MAFDIEIFKKLPNFNIDIKLSCAKGRLLALVGPSGAGKTTIVRTLAGLERPDRGRIAYDGEVWCDTASGTWLAPQKRCVGYVFQEYTLFPHLTVEKNVAFAAKDNGLVHELMVKLGITPLAKRRPREISGGERQRVALAQALARQPKVLILDEPFSALDIATRKRLQNELCALKTELNLPIIHVTHDLQEADLLGDEIVAIEAGQVAEQWLERFLVHASGPALEGKARSTEQGQTL